MPNQPDRLSFREFMMKTTLDLTQLERKIRQETLQDGLLELFFGLNLFAASAMLQEQRNMIPFLFTLLFGSMVFRFLKRTITDPRIGYVELPENYAPDRSARRLYISLGIAIFLLFLAILFLSGDIRHAARWYRWMPLPVGLGLSLVFLMLGRWSGLLRHYLLGALAAASGVFFTFQTFAWKMEALSLTLLAVSLPSIAVGLVLLVRFIIRYPAHKPGPENQA